MKNRTLTLCCIPVLLTATAFALTNTPAASQSSPASSASQSYFDFVLKSCDRVEADIPHITRIAKIAAERNLKGGIIGFPYNYQGLQGELSGRSGGLIHISFGRPHKKDRSPEEKANDMVLIGWQREPFKADLDRLRKYHEDGLYIMGFGPGARADLNDHRALCNAWFDTGFGEDDRVVVLPDGTKAGRANLLLNVLNAWCFVGEYVAALTRHGKMPPMWMSYCYEEGPAWGDKYLFKKQFHDDYTVPPVAAGTLAHAYLDRIRGLVRKFDQTQMPAVERVAQRIVRELDDDRKTTVASMGHMAWTYVCRYEDQEWGVNADLHSNLPNQVKKYLDATPDGALVLRLGYAGLEEKAWDSFQAKHQRVMLITAENPRAGEYSDFLGMHYLPIPTNVLETIDMGYAFGDACVALEGYPIRILPPSGVMQLVAYQTVNCAVLEKLHGAK